MAHRRPVDTRLLQAAAEYVAAYQIVDGRRLREQLGLTANEYVKAYKRLKRRGLWPWRRWPEDVPPCVVCGTTAGPRTIHGRPIRVTGRRWGLPGRLCVDCYNRRSNFDAKLLRQAESARRKERKKIKL